MNNMNIFSKGNQIVQTMRVRPRLKSTPLVLQGQPHVRINVDKTCSALRILWLQNIPIIVFQLLITTYRRKSIQRQTADGLLKGEVNGGFDFHMCVSTLSMCELIALSGSLLSVWTFDQAKLSPQVEDFNDGLLTVSHLQ